MIAAIQCGNLLLFTQDILEPPSRTMVQGIYFNHNCILEVGWVSKSGVATTYGLGGLGLEPQWGGILHIVLISLWGPPILLYRWYWVFS